MTTNIHAIPCFNYQISTAKMVSDLLIYNDLKEIQAIIFETQCYHNYVPGNSEILKNFTQNDIHHAIHSFLLKN